ncbi:MAG: glycine cleavage system protein H [Candidatus Heimdallarchaeota archaeon]|nr:glycine cleavage system protein H [Candidatus Heimdallarchaeota archaeon]
MKRSFRFPENYQYQSTSVWLEDTGRGIYKLGITDYAQYVLDDIISITFPETGYIIEKDDELVSIDSIEDTLIIMSPIGGKITEINEELRQSPELLNESPYEDGWILLIEVSSEDDLDQLVDIDEILDQHQEELAESGFADDEDDFDEDSYEDLEDSDSDY